MTLTREEIQRYNRHIIMPEVGIEGQEKLSDARVLVIGAGGLGCPVLQYLAAAGVGTIGIIDDDVVDESNLQRQILFDTTDVGKQKAIVAKEKLQKQNPHINVNVVTERFTSANALELINRYDLLIDGSDNFPTRYLSNDACVLAGKPLVFGSIFKFQGQATVFNYNNGPTYRCLFPEAPAPGDVPNCSEIGVLGVLPGLIGTIMANEAIKIIIGAGKVLSGKLLTLDALTMNTTLLRFNKSDVKITNLVDYEDFCGLNSNDIEEITVNELKRWIDTNEPFQLIDVRERTEYELGNIGGELIPLNEIESQYSKIQTNNKVVIHCRMGGRSAEAVRMLQNKGHRNLLNLKGGILEWIKHIDPTIQA